MSSLDDLKQRIKETPINLILSNYIHVIARGSTFTALCPFHNDHNPSLQINNSKNLFRCYVDNIGGDAITFVMRFKNMNFIEAMQDICTVMGWQYDQYVQHREVSPKENMARKILDSTTKLYQKAAQSGKFPPFQEFVKNRELNEKIVKLYDLGFAPGNNAISVYLGSLKEEKERGFAISTAIELGLIRKDTYREGETYDTFRDRIVFPIWDHFGKVMGYTTRATRPEQKAKYMNSPESFVFKKGQILYGFHLAKQEMKNRDAVILCEGNMDQIALFQNGFENSVAIMGVALSENGLKRLADLSKNLFLALDNDEGGFKAAERINRQCLEQGLIARYVRFPADSKDPDEFLKAHGALAFQRLLDESLPFLDFQLEKVFPAKTPETTQDKISTLELAMELVAPLGKTLYATERLVTFARRLGLQSGADEISGTYHQYLERKPLRAISFEATKKIEDKKTQKLEPKSPQAVVVNHLLNRSERRLLQEIVQHPECLEHEAMTELLDFVESAEVKRYVSKLRSLVLEVDETEYFSFASNLLNTEDYSLDLREVIGLALEKFDAKTTLNKKVIEKMLGDLKRKLREDQLKMQRDELKGRQQECTDSKELEFLMAQYMKIQQELNQIKLKTPHS